MARNRNLHRIAVRGVSRLNLSRRLVAWMDSIRMPRTALRLRYVRLVHVFHLLDDTCNFHALCEAMWQLLNGWVPSDEGNPTTPYCSRLRDLCCLFHASIITLLD